MVVSKTYVVNCPVLDLAGNPTGEFFEREFTQEEFEERKKKLPERKRCLKCKYEFPLGDYGRDKRQTDGLNRYCKPCHRGNCTKARAARHKPCVYQLFFTDGCTYIGSTIQNFHDRLSVHRAKIRKKIHTNKLFNQYESEDISGRIIMYVQDEQELRMNEYVLIKHYKELYGSKCLNAYFTTGILNENKRQKTEETRNVEEN